jgi:hypothetical protein
MRFALLHDRPITRRLRLALLLLSGLFFGLGGLFLALPGTGAALFGLPSREPHALFFVRAISLRDLALAAYLLWLTLAGERRALSIVLAATLVIPAGDLGLLAFAGTGTPLHYLLHGGSLICFAGMALWVRGFASRT